MKVRKNVYDTGDEEGTSVFNQLEGDLKKFMKGNYKFRGEFEGFCFFNLHRYILDTQRVLYNVSQGRFFDRTEIPKGKWKDKWSPKSFTW